MNRRRFVLNALSAATAGLLASASGAAIEKIDPDPKGVKLCSDLLAALSRESEAERVQATVPLLHKSLLSDDGKDLARQIREFSFKKAAAGAKFYAQPAEIFEVHKGLEQTIGFQNTAERGRVDKYFVKKKEGAAGRPAPLHVFWPKDGGEPKLVNIGSL